MPVQCQITDESSVKKKMEITISNDEIAPAMESELKGLQKYVKLRGFRPGRVPLHIVEKYYGDALKGEVLERLMVKAVGDAAKENDIDLVAIAKLEPGEYQKGKDFTFKADVEVRPVIDEVDYEGLDVTETEVAVEDDEVDMQVERMRSSLAQEKTVEGREDVRRGDVVVVDIKAYVDGEDLLEDYTRDNMEIPVPADGELEGLPKALVGKKIGETAENEVTVSEDDPREELRGRRPTWRLC